MLRLRHVFTTTGATLAGGGLGLLFTLLAARLLAPSENGHYAQFVLIFNLYYILLNFGLGPASTYFISSGQVREQRVVSVNVKAVGAIGVASALCVAGLWLGDGGQWVEAHFKIPPAMLFTGIAAGFFLLVFNQALAILVGKKSFDTVNLLNVLKTALPFPVVALVLLVLAGEAGFAVATLIALLVASLLGMKLVARNLAHAPHAKTAADAGLTHSIFRYGLQAYAANVMHYIAMRGLLIILSYYYAPEHVGFFSIALVLLETLLVIPGVIGQLIFPHSSHPEFDYGLTDTIMRLNVYVGLLTVAFVLLLAPWGIGWILGAKYQSVATALMHLTPSIVVLAVPRILSQVLSGRGHPEYPLYAAIISFFIGGAIALWSIPAYGPAGAAWVTNFVSAVTAVVTVYGYTRLRGVGVGHVFFPQRKDWQLVRRAAQRIAARTQTAK
jgi:O-antigen/teichoic acid export membrane protein